jgi:probable rRNA maturation factor
MSSSKARTEPARPAQPPRKLIPSGEPSDAGSPQAPSLPQAQRVPRTRLNAARETGPAPAETSLLFRHPSSRVRRGPLREFLNEIGRRVGHGCALSCLITTDRELRALNRRFLGHDFATDVLSFPSANGEPGELAISLDRAREQAAQYGHPLETELRILMLHGVLHLAGMDHEADSGEMARAEARWRRRLGLPAGLIERSPQ